MKIPILVASLLLAAVGMAQTTTTYTLPTGTVCNNTPEICNYEIVDAPLSGLFQATTGYYMQFQYRAFPGQNPGYDAEYCNGLGTWTMAQTPLLGPTAAFFTMDCQSKNLTGVPSAMHAEIYAYSYVATYPCGGRVRTICHQTRWAITDGSFISITK